jgi:hypothetical protein
VASYCSSCRVATRDAGQAQSLCNRGAVLALIPPSGGGWCPGIRRVAKSTCGSTKPHDHRTKGVRKIAEKFGVSPGTWRRSALESRKNL